MRPTTPARPRLVAATLTALLAGALLAGCSDDPADDPGAGSSTSGASTSRPVPSAGAEGNPFQTTFEGPSAASPGEVLSGTLTNVGRLPDAYQVVIDPADAAVLKESNYHLSPGESVKVRLKVRSTPFEVHLKSVGGGNPDVVALAVGAR